MPLGHVATTAELRARGIVPARLASGEVVRVRKGVYACSHLAELDAQAAGCGALIDCITVLRIEGIWTGNARGLHLRARHADRRVGGRIGEKLPGARVHRGALRFAAGRTRVGVQEALVQAMRCLPADDLIAAIESAVHLKRITPVQALDVMARAPRRLRAAMAEVDTTFRAQSGLETTMRLRLVRRGHRVEPQFALPGVGHLDNLVDGIVAVETDGRQHAESLAEDHRRDLAAEAWGIHVVRVDAWQLEHDWPTVLGVIEGIVDAERRARAAR